MGLIPPLPLPQLTAEHMTGPVPHLTSAPTTAGPHTSGDIQWRLLAQSTLQQRSDPALARVGAGAGAAPAMGCWDVTLLNPGQNDGPGAQASHLRTANGQPTRAPLCVPPRCLDQNSRARHEQNRREPPQCHDQNRPCCWPCHLPRSQSALGTAGHRKNAMAVAV